MSARSRRRFLAAACSGMLVLVGLLGGAPAQAAVIPGAPTIPEGTTLSGVAAAGGDAGAAAFGTWRGRPVGVITTYTGTSSWAGIEAFATGPYATLYQQAQAQGVVLCWSVPLIPNDGVSTLPLAGDGAYDSYYAQLATTMVASGHGADIIRLGWEAGGDWFNWAGLNDAPDYRSAYQHAVDAMKSVPGAQFTFDWNYGAGISDPGSYYPGDDYVDYVGTDVYDVNHSGDPTDHVATWQHVVAGNHLDWLAAFAVAHHKRISIPEWGLQLRPCDNAGGGDDPYFVDQMYAWFTSHDVAYESYFNHDMGSCEQEALSTGTFPQAAAEYQRLFGVPYVSTAPPNTGTDPAAALPEAPVTVLLIVAGLAVPAAVYLRRRRKAHLFA